MSLYSVRQLDSWVELNRPFWLVSQLVCRLDGCHNSLKVRAVILPCSLRFPFTKKNSKDIFFCIVHFMKIKGHSRLLQIYLGGSSSDISVVIIGETLFQLEIVFWILTRITSNWTLNSATEKAFKSLLGVRPRSRDTHITTIDADVSIFFMCEATSKD